MARFLAYLSLVFFVFSQSFAGLKEDIDQIIAKSGVKKSNLGILIGYSRQDGDILYDANSRKKMVPASLTKVVTAGAVLEKMPIGHQFITTLNAGATVENGVMKGDLYLKGGGDPGFVSESMWFLVNEFVRNEIHLIEGDIVVDDTAFDDVRFDEGRDPGRVDRAYDAPIGAMTFNWSAVNVFIRPTKLGEKPKVFLDPENTYLGLVNNAKVVKGNRSDLRVSRVTSDDKKYVEKIIVAGTIGIDAPESVVYKSISEPGLWAGHHLRAFLKRRGVEVKGKIRLGKMPSQAKELARVKSKPLSHHVADMMKFSNNYVAEILTKNLGLYAKGEPATMEKGNELIREYLKEIGVTDFVLTSPSGLSRRNQFTAWDIFQVLSHLKGNFRVFPEYLSSFPIMGVDGTLKRRMSSVSAALAQVRAKTGHLSGVAGLAGYLSRSDERQLTFVFMHNGSAVESVKAKDLFDRIILRLLE